MRVETPNRKCLGAHLCAAPGLQVTSPHVVAFTSYNVLSRVRVRSWLGSHLDLVGGLIGSALVQGPVWVLFHPRPALTPSIPVLAMQHVLAGTHVGRVL